MTANAAVGVGATQGTGRTFAIVRALRPHQWVKNALVAVPLLTAQRISDWTAVWHTALAVVLFSLLASSVYVLNDLIDVESDRQHPVKRDRPFASGALSARTGWILWPTLVVVSLSVSGAVLPWRFTAVLGGYWLLSTTYTFWAKRQVMVDVVVLAGLYTIRLVAGAAAISAPMSGWLLTFSMLFFLSLALLKRVSELARVRRENSDAHGRGYRHQDLELLSSYGVASSIGAVVIFALFIDDPKTSMLYRTPTMLWLAIPALLAWLMSLWLSAHRGEMDEDPIVFALSDMQSRAIWGLIFLIFLGAKVLSL